MTALQHARFTGVNTVDYDKDPKSVKPLLAQICSIGSNVVGGNELIQWHHLKNGMLVSKKNVVPGWIQMIQTGRTWRAPMAVKLTGLLCTLHDRRSKLLSPLPPLRRSSHWQWSKSHSWSIRHCHDSWQPPLLCFGARQQQQCSRSRTPPLFPRSQDGVSRTSRAHFSPT